MLSVLCFCGKSGRARKDFDFHFQVSASVAFWVIFLDCQTFTNIIEVFLQVSGSPLWAHDAARCRWTDADQHLKSYRKVMRNRFLILECM